MRQLERWGLRIVGILLILLGVTVFMAPRVAYPERELIPHTKYRVKREKVVLVPRLIALLIGGAGVLTLLVTRSR